MARVKKWHAWICVTDARCGSLSQQEIGESRDLWADDLPALMALLDNVVSEELARKWPYGIQGGGPIDRGSRMLVYLAIQPGRAVKNG